MIAEARGGRLEKRTRKQRDSKARDLVANLATYLPLTAKKDSTVNLRKKGTRREGWAEMR
jgi:hypothetical protein